MSSQEGTLDKLLNDLTDSLTEEAIQDAVSFSDDMLEEEKTDLEITDAEITDVEITDVEGSDTDDIISLLENLEEEAPIEEIGIAEELNISDEPEISETLDVPVEIDATTNEDELMSLLQQSDDEELLEIQELLEKSDNNELIQEVDASLVSDLSDDLTSELVDGEIDSNSQSQSEEKKIKRAAQKEARKMEKEAKKAEKLAKKEAKKAEKLAKKEASKTANKEQKLQDNASTDSLPQDGDITDNMLDDLGIDDILADIPVIEEASSNSEEVKNGVEEPSAEDALFADIASLNIFGNPETEMEGIGELDNLTDGVVEDSLKQIVKDEKKKKGFFSKIIDFMTEEDVEEKEDISISEENREILEEMDKEDKKKKKDKKRKKGKKVETSEQTDEDEQEDEEKEDSKKKKKKKEKKPKKEKAPKVESVEDGGGSGRRLSKKGVMVILAACMSLGVLLVLCIITVGDSAVKKVGRQAYYSGDYETVYQNLYGKHLNESEQVMYCKSESILTINMWIREYENLVREGSEREALDSLLQSVHDYPALYTYATEWTASEEVAELYGQILAILSEKYHLTEEQAIEIANTSNDVVYTKMVNAIIAGEEFGSWNQQTTTVETPVEKPVEKLPDQLPEEEGLKDAAFVDNK